MTNSETDPRRSNGLSKDDILDAAVTAFSAKGYRGTNLQDVAGVLGVTRQALYYHYRDKHALLLEMFDEYFDKLDQALETAGAAADAAGLSAIGRFEAMLRAHVLTVTRTRELSTIFTREYEALEPDARESVRARRRAYHRRFVEAFEAARDAGEARDLPTATVIPLIFGAANWTFRWYDHERNETSPDELADILMSLLREGYSTAR